MPTNTEIQNRKAAKRALVGNYYTKVIPRNKLDRDNPSHYTKLVKASKAQKYIFDIYTRAVIANPYLTRYKVV